MGWDRELNSNPGNPYNDGLNFNPSKPYSDRRGKSS